MWVSRLASDLFSNERSTLGAADPVASARARRLSEFFALSGDAEKFFSDYASVQIDSSDPLFPALNALREVVSRYYQLKKQRFGRDMSTSELRLLEVWAKTALAIQPLIVPGENHELAWLSNKDAVSKLKGKKDGSSGTASAP